MYLFFVGTNVETFLNPTESIYITPDGLRPRTVTVYNLEIEVKEVFQVVIDLYDESGVSVLQEPHSVSIARDV